MGFLNLRGRCKPLPQIVTLYLPSTIFENPTHTRFYQLQFRHIFGLQMLSYLLLNALKESYSALILRLEVAWLFTAYSLSYS